MAQADFVKVVVSRLAWFKLAAECVDGRANDTDAKGGAFESLVLGDFCPRCGERHGLRGRCMDSFHGSEIVMGSDASAVTIVA